MIKNILERFNNLRNSPTVKSLSIFTGGNLIVAFVNGISGIIQARWLDPIVFGEFRKYTILQTYLAFGMIFVHDGLIRQYPYLLGKGEHSNALRIAAVAKWWYGYLTITFCAIFFILSTYSLFFGDFRSAIGWGVQIPSSIASVYGAYLGVMYRTTANFQRLTYNNVISSFVGAIELIFVKVWEYWGLAIRYAFMHLISVILNRYYLPNKVKATLDFNELIKLAKISVRFALPGYFHASALIATLNLLVFYYCGENEFGIYTFSVMIQGMLLIFSDSLTQIFYVKISTKFGETEDVYKCLKYSIKPGLIGILISIFLVFFIYIAIDPLIRYFLIDYVNSIQVIKILSFSVIIKAASLPLLIIATALWFRTYTLMCVSNFLVVVILVFSLPKSSNMAALATLIGMFTELLIGIISLFLNYYKK